MTTITNRFKKQVIGAGLAVAGLGASHAWAAGPSHPADKDGWYGSFAIGRALEPGATGSRVELSTAPVPVAVNGQTTWGGGGAVTAAIGRQFRSEDESRPGVFSHWRVEGELWNASISRNAFSAGAFSTALSDDLKATGLFVNALARVYETENTRWWVGGGLGWVNVRLPDANASGSPCRCLGAADGSGAAFRLKAQVERLLSENSSVFLELGYVTLPDASTSGSLPRTTYESPSVVNVSIGLRVRF